MDYEGIPGSILDTGVAVLNCERSKKTNKPMKFLIISYPFPPYDMIGSYRAFKFANFLVGNSADCTVFTVKPEYYTQCNNEMTNKIDHRVNVVRTDSWELKKRRNNNKSTRVNKKLISLLLNGILVRLTSFFGIIDSYMLWVIPAWKHLKLLGKTRFDYVFVTGPPFSSFILAWLFHKKFGGKLILDYRDPWVQNKSIKFYTPIHSYINKWLEKKIIMKSFVITTAQGFNYWRNHGIPDKKVLTMYNGWSEEDYLGLEIKDNTLNNGKINIGYMGSFYGKYNAIPFFNFFLWMKKKDPSLFEKTFIHFVGTLDFHSRVFIENNKLTDNCKCYGFLPHHDALKRMTTMDLLLLMYPPGWEKTRQVYPAKFYEYMPLEKPIIAILPPSLSGDLITRYSAGIFVDANELNSENKRIEHYEKLYAFLKSGWKKYKKFPEDIKNEFRRDTQFKILFNYIHDHE